MAAVKLKLSFEEALTELETIVRALESGNTSLEDAITQYERGAALEAHCRQKLDDAKLRIEKITATATNGEELEPFAHG
ncbi:MAG: exodeoxyribonuclease VII small subunit [Holosporales bacterium]|jgi:exodeoxyribonuclease VII small subunit|nr:exodeoxyribonuclease VII small subunit [Thalassospira sp.]